MNKISDYTASVYHYIERKIPPNLLQIIKGTILIALSQSAGLFARAQTVGGTSLASQDISIIGRIPDQVAVPQAPFYAQINNIFSDVMGTTLSATVDGDSPLPSWLHFSPSLYSALASNHEGYSSIAIGDGVAYATGWYDNVLDIIDINALDKPALLSTFQIGEPGECVATSGNFTYIGSYSGLHVLEVSDPSNPVGIAKLDMPDTTILGIAISGRYAYITYETFNITMDESGWQIIEDESGLQIIDIKDPYNPIKKGRCDIPGYVKGIRVVDGFAYIANGDLGLRIVDVKDPANPFNISCYDTPGYALTVDIANKMAFVAGYSSGLQIINISVPSAPTYISSYPTNSVDFWAWSAVVSDELVYVATLYSGLKVISISDIAYPTLFGTYQIAVNDATDVAAKGDKAILVSHGGDFSFTIFCPKHPCAVFWGTPLEGDRGSLTIQVRAIDALKNSVFDQFKLYVDRAPILLSSPQDQSIRPLQPLNLFIDTKISIYDPDSDPISVKATLEENGPIPYWLTSGIFPYQLGSFEGLSLGFPLIQVVEKIAYVVSKYSGLMIFDVSSSAAPTLIGDMFFYLDYDGDMQVDDSIAYIAGGNTGLHIIDVATPSNLTLINSYFPCINPLGIKLKKKVAFVACDALGLAAINMTDPYHPKTISTYPTQPGAVKVEIDGDLVYLTNEYADLQIIDISSLKSPKLVGSQYDPKAFTYSYMTAADGNRAVTISGIASRIINITDPTNPTVEGVFSEVDLSDANALLRGDLLFAAVRGTWIAVDISKPSAPVMVAHTPFGDAIDVKGDTAYVVGQSGFRIYDLSKWRLTGTPQQGDAGNYEIVLKGKDPAGLSVSSSFKLRVEGAPQLVKPIGNQMGLAGTPFTFFIDQSSFADPNGDIISYSASLLNSTNDLTALPSWLRFSPGGIFTGLATSDDARLYTIQVTAFDGITAATNPARFNLTLVDVIGRQTTRVHGHFNYILGNTVVKNPKGAVKYEVSKIDGSALPQWLHFDPVKAAFSGSPKEADQGLVTILVTGSDSVQPPSSVSFSILVTENSAPRIKNEGSNEVATVGQAFRYVVSDDTFVDDNGDPLTYSASGQGNEPLPDWLHFNSTTRTLSGKPGRGDTNAFTDKICPIKITASDGSSQASIAFSLTVQGTSNAELALSIVGPITSAATLAFAWYSKRGLVLNYFNKEKYQKPKQTTSVGSSFSYPLNIPVKEVKLVQVYKGKSVHFGATKPKKLVEWLTYNTPLPGGLLLPNWLEYDCSKNVLQSKRLIESEDVGSYLVRIYTEASIIATEFELEVQGDREMASISQGGIKHRKNTVIPLDQV